VIIGGVLTFHAVREIRARLPLEGTAYLAAGVVFLGVGGISVLRGRKALRKQFLNPEIAFVTYESIFKFNEDFTGAALLVRTRIRANSARCTT
jgi:hypothetical protein